MKGKGFEQGKKYSLTLKDNSVMEGVFVSETSKHVFLKLKSGYNAGFSKEKIRERKEVGSVKRQEAKLSPAKSVGGKPKIVILHTGGTIASKVDYATGAVTPRFSPEEIIGMYPELSGIARIESRLVSNIPSDDMNFHHYNLLGREISKAVKEKGLKGIILTHGTDTLHYTSAALSFALEGLPIPVVLVGSQRSSDRPSSDAALNLLSAAYFIANTKAKGVFVCMHDNVNDSACALLKGVNARKMHSTRRDAFESVNTKPFAFVDFNREKIDYKEETRSSSESFSFKPFNEKVSVGIIRSRPGLTPEELKPYEEFDGLILEGTGLGHFPIGSIDKSTEKNKEILGFIKKFASSKAACMTTQTIHGRVNLNVYSPGRILKEAGVLGHNLDMTTETAYVKLAWLLSNYDKEKARKLYHENLRGEISTRSDV